MKWRWMRCEISFFTENNEAVEWLVELLGKQKLLFDVDTRRAHARRISWLWASKTRGDSSLKLTG